MGWTALWATLFGAWLSYAWLFGPVQHANYVRLRGLLIVALFAMSVFGLYRAWSSVGGGPGKLWWGDSLLVAIVIFWAIFPPSWFFFEYLMFDLGWIGLPQTASGENPVECDHLI